MAQNCKIGGTLMIEGGSKKVSFNLPHPTDETRLVLKSLGKMLFKNSLRNTLALIWSIWGLPTVKDPFLVKGKDSLHYIPCR